MVCLMAFMWPGLLQNNAALKEFSQGHLVALRRFTALLGLG